MIYIFFSNNFFLSLAELDLSDNGFDERTIEYVHMALGRAPFLKNLTLSDNPRFNLCEGIYHNII